MKKMVVIPHSYGINNSPAFFKVYWKDNEDKVVKQNFEWTNVGIQEFLNSFLPGVSVNFSFNSFSVSKHAEKLNIVFNSDGYVKLYYVEESLEASKQGRLMISDLIEILSRNQKAKNLSDCEVVFLRREEGVEKYL